jgi:uncharacterized protein (DUF2252 family)
MPKAPQAKAAKVFQPIHLSLKASDTAASVQGTGIDLRRPSVPWERRHDIGRQIRDWVPRDSHGRWTPAPDRPDPIDIVIATNSHRRAKLVPLRMGRMSLSPFAFLRGAAAVMAWDLSRTPTSGIRVVMDGDAHLNNFGLYGTPQGEVVFDLNDFDETTIGPWEWDVKRLAASVNVAARERGMSRRQRRQSVIAAVAGYRESMASLECMGVIQTWSLHASPDNHNPLGQQGKTADAVFSGPAKRALLNNSLTLLPKVAEKTGKTWRFKSMPPVQTRVDAKTRDSIIAGLDNYAQTLLRERRYMLSRYQVIDACHRVVGVGSVGTLAYLVLLFGNGETDPLFVQVKEATIPAHAPHVEVLPEEYKHEGKRVVMGQRALQAISDFLLGWTEVGGRPFYVRQMRNMKGSVAVDQLSGKNFDFYGWACGTVLARAHARTGDAAAIAGYCGKSNVFDKAIADFAEAYGDQTIADHAALLKAIRKGRVKAEEG